jgi:CheY-like chemotaxis protein
MSATRKTLNLLMFETSPKRILVVDDDPLFLKSISNVLESEGYVVVTANGGQAGIDAFTEAVTTLQPFAAVVTDFGMRVVDGRAVAIAVKTALPSTPVILITGWGQWFEDDGGRTLPVDCILNKPPKLRELREALAKFFGPPNP